MRSGLVVKKIGMSSMFDEKGDRHPVTFLKVDDCQVVAHKTLEKDGYNALVLGSGNTKLSKISKSMKHVFVNANVQPKAKLKEFRVSEENLISIGSVVDVDHFVVGQIIDITGISIGKGFAGGMKRHNFRGLEASHGVSISHRSHGSTGGRQDPGRVFKNKKMAGHMGSRRVTTQNLQIMLVDKENFLIAVRGNVPGSKGGYLYVKDSVKRSSVATCI